MQPMRVARTRARLHTPPSSHLTHQSPHLPLPLSLQHNYHSHLRPPSVKIALKATHNTFGRTQPHTWPHTHTHTLLIALGRTHVAPQAHVCIFYTSPSTPRTLLFFSLLPPSRHPPPHTPPLQPTTPLPPSFTTPRHTHIACQAGQCI